MRRWSVGYFPLSLRHIFGNYIESHKAIIGDIGIWIDPLGGGTHIQSSVLIAAVSKHLGVGRHFQVRHIEFIVRTDPSFNTACPIQFAFSREPYQTSGYDNTDQSQLNLVLSGTYYSAVSFQVQYTMIILDIPEYHRLRS